MVGFVPIFAVQAICLIAAMVLRGGSTLVRKLVRALNALTRGHAIRAIGLTVALFDLA